MSNLTGETAVITGGNSGIGHAAAKKPKGDGANAIITGRSPERVQTAANELGVKGIVADVINLSALDNLVEQVKSEFTRLDILFVNAGIFAPAAFNAWIDQIVRSNVTFRYFDNGPAGLLEGKKAYVVIAFDGTQMGSGIDYFSYYIRHILIFIGIKDLTFTDSSGTGRNEEHVLNCAYEAIAAI